MRLNGKELPGFGSSLAAILITVLIDHFCSQAEPQRAAGLAWAQPLPPGTQPGPDNFRPQRFVPPFPPITEFGLQKVRDSQSTMLSGGERRRLEVARALATRPKLIFFDEPFYGVDPIATEDIQRIIYEFRRRGTSVLLTVASSGRASR